MNQVIPFPERRLVLATDLDGTFLGGPATARRELYRWIEARRHLVTLIFVTGRDLPFIRELTATTEVPHPNYVIGDVGTTIAGGADIEPLPALERFIAERWNDAGPAIREMLDGEPGLTPQDTPFRHRQSYYYDPDAMDPGIVARIESAGFDCLLSADTYLDVLPRGISKGPALLHLIGHLGIAPESVLVAGDTLNDLSLFETGLAGVAVGNAEAALRERLSGNPHVLVSRAEGAAGILDALARFAWLPETAA